MNQHWKSGKFPCHKISRNFYITCNKPDNLRTCPVTVWKKYVLLELLSGQLTSHFPIGFGFEEKAQLCLKFWVQRQLDFVEKSTDQIVEERMRNHYHVKVVINEEWRTEERARSRNEISMNLKWWMREKINCWGKMFVYWVQRC